MKNLVKLLFLFLISYYNSYGQEAFPVNGVDENYKPTYAFINAHIVISGEKEIKNGTLIIRDRIILEVDSNIAIPNDAIVYNLKGDYVYPSFIDLYSDYGLKKTEKESSSYRPQYKSKKKGAYHWNQAIHPEIHASHEFNHDKERLKYLEMGFGSLLTHKQDGIFRGTGCLTLLANNQENDDILMDKAATFYSFKKGASKQRYPTSLMGSIALVKQTLLDAEWYENTSNHSNISLSEYNSNKYLPKIFELKSHLDYSRLFKISDEFEIDYIVK